VILYWDQQQIKKTIMLDPSANNIELQCGVSYCTLIEQYGTIEMEDCQFHANDKMMKQQRDAQNLMMLYQFLSSSTSDDMKSKLTVQSEKFEIQGHLDGTCFLKLIISTALVDTIASVSVLRNIKLELAGNLIDFHTHVQETVRSLAAYGETMQNTDLLTSTKNFSSTSQTNKSHKMKVYDTLQTILCN
jgi:hypothetical protein